MVASALDAGNKVLPPTAERCAAPIAASEIEEVCTNLPIGKSPGPDRLPNKFYAHQQSGCLGGALDGSPHTKKP